TNVSEVMVGGVSCEALLPPDVDSNKVVFWLHGGGYGVGSAKSHRGFLAQLSKCAGSAGMAANYRLAPEHPFPAAVDDAVAAYQGLLAEGVKPADLVVGGDSAGGGLALAMGMKLKELGAPMPAGFYLISPWANLENTGWSYDAKASRDPVLSKEELDKWAVAYAQGQNRSDPLMSPVNGDLRGLPPVYIQVGEAEILLSDSSLLAERLGGAGVPVSMEVWPDMLHVWHIFYPNLAPARDAILRAGAWIKGHLGDTA
ncbi:MAG: alpha/beta hydrolase, partial [Pseudomonadota bacterium]